MRPVDAGNRREHDVTRLVGDGRSVGHAPS